MPVATKFESEGVDNGFPFCPARIDVDAYDKWTSLSGWSKVSTPIDDDAKALSIAESKTLAMRLFWNLNGFNGSGIRSDWASPFYADLTLDMYTGDYEESGWSKLAGGTDSDVNKEPKERVCYKNFNAGKRDPDLGGWIAIGLDISIVRMYDAGVFVGYGVSNWCATVATIFFDYLDLTSYASIGGDYVAVEYVDFDGMHFVAGLQAEDDFFGDNIYSISVIDENVVGSYSSVLSGITATMTIEPFDFYTYPA